MHAVRLLADDEAILGFREMTNEEYHADTSAYSSSQLKHILNSPAHFKHALENRRVETDSMALGSAIHCAVLEPERFHQEYVVAIKFDRRTKEGKAQAEAFEANNAGKKIISPDDMSLVRAISEAILDREDIHLMLQVGTAEQSLFWRDPETGILLKCRPDFLGDILILDVKSTVDASKDGFSRECAKYSYHISAAMYQEGVYEATGERLPFVFVAAEKEAPHPVAVYQASDAFIEKGMSQFRLAMTRLAQCIETDFWPAYQPDGLIETVDLPRWAS